MRTIGKNRGLARLADADGHFRMVALDQRPPLFEAIAQAKRHYQGSGRICRRHGGQAAIGRGAGAALQLDAVRSEFRGAGRDRSAAAALRVDHDAGRASGRGDAGRPQVARDRQLERGQDPRHRRRRRQGAGLVSARCGRRRQRASEGIRARDRRGLRPPRHPLCARTPGLSFPRQRQPHGRLCGIARQAAVTGDRERARIRQARIWRRPDEARKPACCQQPAAARRQRRGEGRPARV